MSTAFVTVIRGDIAGAPQNVPAGTWTTVQFDIAEGDGENQIYSTSNYRFTAPYTGYYEVHAHIEWTGNGNALRIVKNDNTAFPVFMSTTPATPYINLHHIFYLAKNEFITIQAFSTAGSNIDAIDTIGGVSSRITNTTFILIKNLEG